ncbi:MAG: hypothetical protein Kapaf2KO_19800 [Candidatus Kapaibacteriales bacterium]
MSSLRKVIGIFLFGLVMTSCGSIMNGTSQKVYLKTEPRDIKLSIRSEGYIIYTDSIHTPVELQLKRGAGYFKKAHYSLIIEADGCNRTEYFLNSSVSSWYVVGNIFSFGLPGFLVVDPLTGGMWKINEDEIILTLEKSK